MNLEMFMRAAYDHGKLTGDEARELYQLATDYANKHPERTTNPQWDGIKKQAQATQNTVPCNHWWFKSGDKEYCEDCGIEFWESQANATKAPVRRCDVCSGEGWCPVCSSKTSGETK